MDEGAALAVWWEVTGSGVFETFNNRLRPD